MSVAKRRARLTLAGTLALGIGASVAVVWNASYSAFSTTTSNPTSNWTAGSVALTDDDSNTALFTVSAVKPGQTGTKCIVVTSTSNLPSSVKMYTTAGSYSQTSAVGDNLTLVVTQGSGTPGSGSCTGFTADTGITTTKTATTFASTYTSFATGFGTWAPAAGTVTHSYQIQWTFGAGAPNTTQGGNAQLGFTWELQTS